MIGGFEEYLSKKAFIPDKYIPYYVKWVSSCYSFIEQPDNCLLSPEQLQGYLNHISKTREDWQVKQAEKALRLYGYYLSSELMNPAETVDPGSPPETGDLWAARAKSMRDALRLRHRSYSTEKTYIGWVRAFQDYE